MAPIGGNMPQPREQFEATRLIGAVPQLAFLHVCDESAPGSDYRAASLATGRQIPNRSIL